MNPIDPRRSERHLLAALVRWARTNGWRSGGHGWENPGRTFAIEPRDGEVVIWWLSTGTPPWPRSALSSCRYILADSITQAIDLLVVHRYLPPMWSSAYALAEAKYVEQAETQVEEMERLRSTNAYLTSMLRYAEQKTAEAIERRDDAEKRLWAARMVKCWTNEDGKRFVFADDLLTAVDPELAAKAGGVA